jgi:hypothetical protein
MVTFNGDVTQFDLGFITTSKCEAVRERPRRGTPR